MVDPNKVGNLKDGLAYGKAALVPWWTKPKLCKIGFFGLIWVLGGTKS